MSTRAKLFWGAVYLAIACYGLTCALRAINVVVLIHTHAPAVESRRGDDAILRALPPQNHFTPPAEQPGKKKIPFACVEPAPRPPLGVNPFPRSVPSCLCGRAFVVRAQSDAGLAWALSCRSGEALAHV